MFCFDHAKTYKSFRIYVFFFHFCERYKLEGFLSGLYRNFTSNSSLCSSQFAIEQQIQRRKHITVVI